MLQVRCPECGYLQSLSEERFLSISDNFLNCPHCNAKVPKEWAPQQEESAPEEVRHKMLAFSKRILNGRDVRLEVVYALESLVRHYGPAEGTNKALGIGYALVGEHRKAEEFLAQCMQETPGDPEILHSHFGVLLAQKKYRDAVDAGMTLLQAVGSDIDDEDVAGLALSLIEIGQKDEARELFNSHPGLDPRNPAVKQVRRKLSRRSGSGILGLFRARSPVRWLKEATRKESSSQLPSASESAAKDNPKKNGSISQPARTEKGIGPQRPVAPQSSGIPVWVEYWIYTPGNEIPRWQEIRSALADRRGRQEETERALVFLDLFIQNNSLAVEYIRKSDAKEFFDYPEEIIPHNSREVNDADRKILHDSSMIVRLKLCLADFSGTSHLSFMVRLVEAVRFLTGGVVQDAVSHTLWGTEAWTRMVENPAAFPIESHVQFETVDEGEGRLWLHTHGMQKFGLLDMEMEEAPAHLAQNGRAIMALAAQTILSMRDRGKDLQPPLPIPGTPFLLGLQKRQSDEEGHFPAGSVKLIPYSAKHDPQDRETIGQILEALVTYLPENLHSGPGKKESEPETNPESDSSMNIKQNLLNAHKRARQELSIFKRSFQQAERADPRVHAVKIGFPAQGGQLEWMWVSLDAWQGEFLAGHVENTPVLRKDLEKGSVIKISEREIFDWVITQEGKVLQGGYTERNVG
jgi:uncharacterized protein YegJ (DUF2314 family)